MRIREGKTDGANSSRDRILERRDAGELGRWPLSRNCVKRLACTFNRFKVPSLNIELFWAKTLLAALLPDLGQINRSHQNHHSRLNR